MKISRAEIMEAECEVVGLVERLLRELGDGSERPEVVAAVSLLVSRWGLGDPEEVERGKVVVMRSRG